MKEEIWKPIEGYEGLYEVSSWGRVRSLDKWVAHSINTKKFMKGRIRKLQEDGHGYLKVELSKNGKVKTYKVHRLVAEAFIPNPKNYNVVNHKDEVKTNNYVDNLEWCTHSYNVNYGTGIQRKTEKMINGKLSKTVYQYSLSGELIAEYPSTIEVQRQLGFDCGNISKCCTGKKKNVYGYIWRYTPLDNVS